MASAERDRVELTSRIQQLEMDRRDLETSTGRKEEENGILLDQLELLNTTVADSETRIKTLEAALQSSQQAIRRLEAAAARAADLERHLVALETEQASLQANLLTSETAARSAIHRWRKAEREVSELQAQLERIEHEAKEERQRHLEAIGRMERQRALDAAAGRLKGAAAAKERKAGAGVVSHFVRDLLEDNANLQIGIAELRELLAASNDEIQSLRDQLPYHQALPDGEQNLTLSLRSELEPASMSQELHIHHHHYHVANKPEAKRSKRRRPTVLFPTSPMMPTTPPNGPWRLNQAGRAGFRLPHAPRGSTSTVSATSNRWSLFSESPTDLTPSSIPSSPLTLTNPPDSMCEGAIVGVSVSESPTASFEPGSPSVWAAHQERTPQPSIQAYSTPWRTGEEGTSASAANFGMNQRRLDDSIPAIGASRESEGGVLGSTVSRTAASVVAADLGEPHSETPRVDEDTEPLSPGSPRPALRRAISHESIMSVGGGLDLHTLKARPSQLALRPLGASAAGTGLSAVVAQPTLSSGRGDTKRGSVVLRDSLALSLPLPKTRVVSATVAESGADANANANTGRLGRLVSWMPWASASGGTAEPASPTAQRSRLTTTAKSGREMSSVSRAAGINQPGSIPCFYEYWTAHQQRGPPSNVSPDIVDRDALRDILEDG